MLNYIKSELYKTFHRKYPYIFTGICSLLCIGFNLRSSIKTIIIPI